MLEQAQRVGNEQGKAWQLHVGIGEDMPMFDDASFDLVTAYAIHHEMPPRIIAAIFKEAFRVLKPGGDMVMADVTRTGELDKMAAWRSEEHTSELQSLMRISYAVFCLKKKNITESTNARPTNTNQSPASLKIMQ